jgi:hypothetical protein
MNHRASITGKCMGEEGGGNGVGSCVTVTVTTTMDRRNILFLAMRNENGSSLNHQLLEYVVILDATSST